MNLARAFTIAGAVAIGVSAGAFAQTVQVGDGGAGESCWRAALATTFEHVDSARMDARWKSDAIGACDDALKSSKLDRVDTASTWVNRGILEMSRERYANARGNFKEALNLIPKLAEAHVDMGSALINLQKYADGIKETELGLGMGSKEAQRGYYNLGIAYGEIGDLQKSYDSFRRASEIDPDWDDPKKEMARFTLRQQETKAQ